MKERIVIPKDKIKVLTSCDCFPANGYFTFYKEDIEVEQVPENFADLLTLCKDLKDVDIEEADEIDVARIIIHNADLIYFEDEILMIAGFKKLEIKPQQMWQIIKNLIGEE